MDLRWLALTCGGCALVGWSGALLWVGLRSPSPPPPPARWPSTLQGRIRELPPTSLLALLEMERKSGILLLQRGASLGQLRIRDGRVIAAGLQGDGLTLRGIEVVYELLAWADGRFDFIAAEISGADEIGASTTHLLMEGARRLDEGDGLLLPAGPLADAPPQVDALLAGARAIELGE